ncbi:MAG: rhomboid family intramembrane serine protease [Acidobacteriaceae bacterium]|nr:rhomboid family intramembrane serine protease [Acidobacteriaceae bacterium]
MARSSIPFALPPFRGLTRRIVLLVLGFWLLVFLISLRNSEAANLLTLKFSMRPDETLGRQIWQPFTYSLVYLHSEFLSVLFGVLSFWFFASELESERGSRWLGEFLGIAAVIGGLLAALLTRFVFFPLTGMVPTDYIWGLGPLNIAIILAYARFYPDRELVFNFLLRLKAKYLAAIYVLIYMASSLTTGHRFDALVAVCVSVLRIRLHPLRSSQRHAFSLLGALVRSPQRLLPQQAAPRGQEVHRLHEEAGQGCEPRRQRPLRFARRRAARPE